MTAALAAATSLGLALGGMALGFREVAPYFSSGYSEEERFQVLAGGDVYPGVSRFGRDMYLDDCTDTASGTFALFQPQEDRNKVIDNCLTQVAALQQAAPVDARVWIVSAELEAAAGRLDAMKSAIVRSRQASPGIVPYAIRRLNLLDSHGLADADRTGRTADLTTLFNSASGRQYLSERYVAGGDGQAEVATLLAAQPIELQRKFVEVLQRVNGGGT